MANYDYVTLEQLENALMEAEANNGEVIVKSTRGKWVAVEVKDVECEDGTHIVANVHNDHCSYGTYDDCPDGFTDDHVIFDMLLALNCWLKIGTEYKRISYTDGLVYVNNPMHDMFGKIIDMTTGKTIR